MAKQAWTALVIITVGMAIAPPCLGDDDARDADSAAKPTPELTSIDELLAASSYTEVRFAPTALGGEARSIAVPELAIDLEDNSVLGRVRRARSLSFLTFFKQRRSQFFLGINEDGFVGLHFTGSSASSD